MRITQRRLLLALLAALSLIAAACGDSDDAGDAAGAATEAAGDATEAVEESGDQVVSEAADAAGILEIYGPVVEKTAISFETDVPTRADIEERSAKAVVNLASAEYASSVQLDDLGVPVITPVFKDANKGGYRVISFFAKRARGMMASWMVRERVATRKAIRSFDVGGYRYSEADSTTTAPVFLRD